MSELKVDPNEVNGQLSTEPQCPAHSARRLTDDAEVEKSGCAAVVSPRDVSKRVETHARTILPQPAPWVSRMLRNAKIEFLLAPREDTADLYADQWNNPQGDSGVDIRFPTDFAIPQGVTAVVDLGVRAACFVDRQPTGFWLVPRSSFGKTQQILVLRNMVGIFDQNYRGPVTARIYNFGPGEYVAKRGESLLQLIEPMMRAPTSAKADPLHPAFATGATVRGAGGFGSTGAAGQGSAVRGDVAQSSTPPADAAEPVAVPREHAE